MAINSSKESWERDCNSEQEEEEEDEALSLSDLPVNLIDNEENQSRKEETQATKTADQEEFDFGSWGGSIATGPEMCAADEVFFKGQILPLRLSVSSDNGLAGVRHESRNSRCVSRSESMDHGSLGGFTSNSSRSSSIRSHTSSSTNSTTTATKTYKPKVVRNQFHTHPSPKPQIRLSTTTTRLGNVGNRSQKSTIWDFFRLSLVHTPEIELKDLKVRSKNGTSKRFGSRNSSSSSNSNSSTKNLIGNTNSMDKQKRPRFLNKHSGFLGGCKCSVSSVEPVPSNIVIIKSSSRSMMNDESSTHDIKEKLQELKKMKRKQQGKQAMSRHRTFEWLKELSHAGDPDERA